MAPLHEVQSGMATFTEQDIEALEQAGITVVTDHGPDSAYAPDKDFVRSGLLGDGGKVQIQLVDLGTGEMGDAVRAFWYEVIHRTSHIAEPGIQRLTQSFDMGKSCLFVVPHAQSLTQYLRERGGAAKDVFQVIHTVGLAILGLVNQNLTPTDLRLLDICVTPEGVAQIRFGTELTLSDPVGAEQTTGHRKFGPVGQLRRLVQALQDQQIVSQVSLAPLMEIFEETLAADPRENNIGDLLIAVHKYLTAPAAPAHNDLVRKAPRPTRNAPYPLKPKLLIALGGATLVVCVGLIFGPQFLGRSDPSPVQDEGQVPAQAQAQNQESSTPANVGQRPSDSDLVASAEQLLTQRFEIIEQVSVGRADLSNVAQVVLVDSPAYGQLTALLATLKAAGTKVVVPQVTVLDARVIKGDANQATVHLTYELVQNQHQGGAQVTAPNLVEEVELTLQAVPTGWRISDARVLVS